MDLEKLSDEELVKEYRQGNTGVFNILYSRHSGMVNFFCKSFHRQMVVFGIDIDDLSQEGYKGLLNAINSYDEKLGASFKTYASTCVKNSIITAIKKGVRDSSLFTLENEMENQSSLDFEDDYLDKILVNDLWQKIERILTPQEKATLELYLQGLKYKEIAERIQISSKAVEKSLCRARKKIKEKVVDKED